jgi:hypothetical protein
LDALVILRHSIHVNSVHNDKSSGSLPSASVSKYGYKMYAFVHRTNCPDPALPPLLERLGYTPLVVDDPVELQDIEGEWYRNHVEGENCCGLSELIKLRAYEIDAERHPIVVHWDLDVAVLKPMDVLFDVMLYGSDHPVGKEARHRLLEDGHVQRGHRRRLPGGGSTLPNEIGAFFTRDVTSAAPWERIRAVQGGFVVMKPNRAHYEILKDLIRKGNYVRGRGEGSGWGVSI